MSPTLTISPLVETRIERARGSVRLERGGLAVAQSNDALALYEASELIAYLVPEADVNHSLLVFSNSRDQHPAFGALAYLSLRIDGVVWKDVAWRGERLPELAGRIAFTPAAFDTYLDGQLQPALAHTPSRVWVSTDDHAVIHQIADGSECAVRLLHDRFRDAVFALAYRIVDDESAAEDIVQEVFMEIYARSHQWNPERGRLSTWILAITRYTAIDTLNQRKPLSLPDDDERLLDESAFAGQLDQQTNWEMRIALANLISDLPLSYRDVIQLIYLEGMTQQQAAVRLNLPLGTVKTRIRRALDLLREQSACAL